MITLTITIKHQEDNTNTPVDVVAKEVAMVEVHVMVGKVEEIMMEDSNLEK